jgi:hypothetical protein
MVGGGGSGNPGGGSGSAGGCGAGPILRCTPDDFTTAADGAARVRDELAEAVRALACVLKGSAGAAGSDDLAKSWGNKYDPACGGREGAYGVMEASSDAVNSAGMLHDLLLYTGMNHANADDPDAPAAPPGLSEIFKVPAIPKAYGGDYNADEPWWWKMISGFVMGKVWPNGHQAQLNTMGDAYASAAGAFRCAVGHFPAIVGLVNAQRIPEGETVVKWCNTLKTTVEGIATTLDGMCSACHNYAHEIDDVHNKIKELGEEFLAWTAAIEGLGALGTLFTLGGSEGAAQVAEAARAAKTGEEIVEAINVGAKAAEAVGLVAEEAGAAAATSVGEVRPLLEAEAALYTGEASAEASGISSEAEQILVATRRRVTLRQGTKKAIQDKAEKTPDGDYIDPNTDEVIPKDGPFDYGHKPNHEWWRTQQEERERANGPNPMTRKEVIERENNPDQWQIESPSSNRSHKFESPRETP